MRPKLSPSSLASRIVGILSWGSRGPLNPTPIRLEDSLTSLPKNSLRITHYVSQLFVFSRLFEVERTMEFWTIIHLCIYDASTDSD